MGNNIQKHLDDNVKIQKQLNYIDASPAMSSELKDELRALVMTKAFTYDAADKFIERTKLSHAQSYTQLVKEYEKMRDSDTAVVLGDIFCGQREHITLCLRLDEVDDKLSRLSSSLASLGNIWGMLFFVAVTASLSLLWLDKAYGLDFLGNYTVSLVVGCVLVVLIDCIGILLVTALLSAVYVLFRDEMTAITIQHIFITLLLIGSVIFFVAFIYYRIASISI